MRVIFIHGGFVFYKIPGAQYPVALADTVEDRVGEVTEVAGIENGHGHSFAPETIIMQVFPFMNVDLSECISVIIKIIGYGLPVYRFIG